MLPLVCTVSASSAEVGELACKSAVLMNAETGEILFEQNADEALPPASVTKVMTLLLVMEAIEAGRIGLDDKVRVSEKAASMGGSQVFLKEGEEMSVEEMLKCVVIASANDCAVALAEHVAGSEEGFVAAMNARAVELGMKNTHFENTNGLDDTVKNHVTSARDIAIMSRALIAYPKILEYSGIWMDTIRDGAFGLTNTNRLVRFYPGCTGLKTGSTARAGFCVSATATREGLSLVCVIMGAESRDARNAAAAKLLDFGFSNFESKIFPSIEDYPQNITVRHGVQKTVPLEYNLPKKLLFLKGASSKLESRITLPQYIDAPLEKGTRIGSVDLYSSGEKIKEYSITVAENAEKITFKKAFSILLEAVAKC
jgi:D-alanyl-D-alanine carboxypeptidase (penicillin-binding protein 5/6)